MTSPEAPQLDQENDSSSLLIFEVPFPVNAAERPLTPRQLLNQLLQRQQVDLNQEDTP